MANSESNDCSFCSEYGPQYYCSTCPTFYCGKCSKHSGNINEVHELESLNINCKKHTKIKSVIFCEICDITVCQNCILEHTGGNHSLIRIQDAIVRKQKIIHLQTERLKTELEEGKREIKEGERELEEMSENTNASCDDFFRTLEEDLIKTVKDSVLEMKNKVDVHLASRPNHISKKIDQLKKVNREIKRLLDTVPAKFTCKDIIEFTDSEWRTFYLKENVKPLERVDEYVHNLGSEKLGELKHGIDAVFKATYQKHFHDMLGKDNDSFKTTALEEIKIGVDSLWDIVCTPQNSIICSAKNSSTLYEIENGSKSQFLSTDFNPEYLAMSPSSDVLLFTSLYQVFKASVTNKEITEFFRMEYTCELSGLTFSTNGHVLLCLSDEKDKKRSVLDLNIHGDIQYEYFKSKDGKRLFANPLYITENEANDGDICVSDNYLEVLSITRQKEIRFVYQGRESSRFDPRGLACDDNGNVLISDFANNCLHVVDKRGQLIREIGQGFFSKPTGLCIDRQGRIWVAEYENGRVKMIDKTY